MTLDPPALTLNQVLDNCRTIAPDQRSHCLMTVMRDYGVQPIGCPRASDMVPRTLNLHKTGTPPAGAIVLWTHGTNGDGHVTVSAGQGDCWTVDFGGPGLFQKKVSIAAINQHWDKLVYKGWATNYGGRYQLDVADHQVITIPSLKLSLFVDARTEMDKPRSVRQHPMTVRTAEHALKGLGFNPGPIDGHYGTGTDDAVKAFQVSLNDPPDGRLGPKQWAKLAQQSQLFVAVA